MSHDTPMCPRCLELLAGDVDDRTCPSHGPVPPLWRPDAASYDALVAQLERAASVPTYLPWPMSPGWTLTDLGVVGETGRARATMTCASGPSDLDGHVDLLVVAEELGTGLGAVRAGLGSGDPDPGLFAGPSQAKLRVAGQEVRLWPVSLPSPETGDPRWATLGAAVADPLVDPLFAAGVDRSVLVGEAQGRWLWLMLRPASALLLLGRDLALGDAAGLGPALVELGFSGPPPAW